MHVSSVSTSWIWSIHLPVLLCGSFFSISPTEWSRKKGFHHRWNYSKRTLTVIKIAKCWMPWYSKAIVMGATFAFTWGKRLKTYHILEMIQLSAVINGLWFFPFLLYFFSEGLVWIHRTLLHIFICVFMFDVWVIVLNLCWISIPIFTGLYNLINWWTDWLTDWKKASCPLILSWD